MNHKSFIIIILSICLSLWVFPKETKKKTILEKLQILPGIKIQETVPKPPFKKSFNIFLTQPLDHENPEGEKFTQFLILNHLDESRPVNLNTRGYYMATNYSLELCKMLQTNQLRVEHRFFGKSKPSQMKWKYLNLKQAVEDLHRITIMFKKIYKGTWISSGWSKGGATALMYRSKYPNDINATVAYDSPIKLELEDQRVDEFFEKVGTPECRQKLKNFQRLALKKKSELLPLFRKYAKEKNRSFSIGELKALEYCILEYPFSFWQYFKLDCNNIPNQNASAKEIFNHLKMVVSFSSYSDKHMNSPAMYQFCTETGYYGYITEHLKDLLSSKKYPNCAFAPQNTPLIYNPEISKNLLNWLQRKGNKIIYIYGEQDPWAAAGVTLPSSHNLDAYVMTLKGGNHYTYIQNFPEKDQQIMLNKLKEWLKIK